MNTNLVYCPKVSIVIPTYNRANIITNCINSILNQSYSNIEIVIVDDCSTDNTEKVIKDLNNPIIKFYRLDKNRRACYARNFGAAHSTGELIAFQDSDDTWEKDKIEKQVTFLYEKQVDVVFCGMTRTEGKDSFYYPRYKINTESGFLQQELVRNSISTQTILLRREVMEKVQFDIAFKKYQDWDFGIQLALNCKIGYLAESLANSVVLSDSISIQSTHFEAMNQIYKKYQDILDKYPSVRAQCQERLGDCFRRTESRKAKEYYYESLKDNCTFKVLIKYIVSLFGIKR